MAYINYLCKETVKGYHQKILIEKYYSRVLLKLMQSAIMTESFQSKKKPERNQPHEDFGSPRDTP
jgi:hypothetical protein